MPTSSRKRFGLCFHFVIAIHTLYTLFSAPVYGDCECGYAAAVGNDHAVYTFTDLLETDFANVSDVSRNTDWARQAFNVTAAGGRGRFGEMFAVENVVSRSNGMDVTTGRQQATSLQLTVRSSMVEGMVPGAEIDSNRSDIWWGSFRANMKLTNVSGTCSAFFWYFNDTEEIDMEFLSKDFNASNGSYLVNLVLQPQHAAATGSNAELGGNFVTAYLPFDPTTDFHEYRVDMVPDNVYFYADGQLLAHMNGSSVPTHAGHLILQHWSNGNRLWSGGPPAQDAVMEVSYVKAYFNSSTTTRQKDWARRCRDPGAKGAVCSVPSVSPQDQSAKEWFFSSQSSMIGNQTVSGQNSVGSHVVPWRFLAVWSLTMAFVFL